MKMRFWQKTYLLTLILFLLCLNIGILSLTVYTHKKNIEAAEDAFCAEQYYVALNFERDHRDVMEVGGSNSSPSLLMSSYGSHYFDKGLFLEFKKSGVGIYSSIDGKYEIGKNQIIHRYFDGQRHILISSSICSGEYELIVARNVSSLDEEFRQLMLTYLLTSLAISLLFAIALYFILKKLSSPLDSLRRTTEEIQGGSYDVAADESGNDEFALLAKSFNSMIDKINEQMKALGQDAEKSRMLVDNLAHELRTPLTSIYGYAEILEKAALSEEMRIDCAKYIMSESKRLQKISEILLDRAYIRENKPEMTEADIGSIASLTLDRLKYKADKQGVELICEEFKLTCRANETLISMLLYNLTENAIKACSKGGLVAVRHEKGTICIQDNGKGMSEEQLIHITEPFYRTDKSRSREEGGVGLGLALCKQIVEVHGIGLDFQSQIGVGTKIFLDFTSLLQL